MADLHITGVDRLSDTELVIQVSDGRTLTFTLAKLLTLAPEREVTEQDAEDFDS